MSPQSKLFPLLLVLAAACQSAEVTLGPAGGVVSSGSGATVQVPEGALAEEVSIRVSKSEVSPPGALGPAFLFEPEGLTFQKPVTITLPYTRTPGLATDIDDDVLVLRAANPAETFEPIGGTVVSDGLVQAQTSSFSVYVAGTKVPTTIADRQGYPKGIAVNASHVFWTNYGTATQPLSGDAGLVMRAALGGGAPQVFATGQIDPKQLALTGSFVYWTNGGSGKGDSGVMRAPIGGGAPSRIVTTGYAIDIAVDSQYVYWTDADKRTVNRAALDGSAPTVLASTGAAPIALAVSGASVFWLSRGASGGADGSIMKVAVQGGTPTTLAGGQAEPVDLATDGSHVFWVNQGDGAVRRVPVGGGNSTTLRTMTRPNAIAVDATYYYVGEILPGKILRYPKSGGNGVARSTTEDHPNRITLDASNVFWVNDGTSKYTGTVKVIRK